MKKRYIVGILVTIMLCLTGCQSVQEPIPNKPNPDPVDVLQTKTKLNEDLEEVKKLLEDKGYTETDYKLIPEDSYLYPEYVVIDDVLHTVYLKNGVLNSKKSYYDYSMGVTYANKSPSIGSIISDGLDSFLGIGSVDSIIPKWNSGNTSSLQMDGFSIGESYYESDFDDVLPIGEFNTSEYKNVDERGFTSVILSPLSTFAADVDNASYTNIRSIIRDVIGRDRETYYYLQDSLHDVRIEEMVNYFDYNFADKSSNEDFQINTEIVQTPWNKDTKLMITNVKARDLTSEEETGSNLVFLIDTSGSMDEEDKLPLLVEALKLLTAQLTEKDTVSVVTYSGDSYILLDGVKGNEHEKIINKLNKLEARGSTNGGDAIKKAYKLAAKYQKNHSNSRIIMCSDGDLNVGITSEDELLDLIIENRESGIYLSVLGFGSGNYKDSKMELLADNGNGNYYYIDNIKEAERVLVRDLMSTLVTLGDDVKFQIEFNPNYVKGYRQIGYENREMAADDFNDDTKDGGEVGYGHEVTVVYEIVLTDSEKEISTPDLKYQETTVKDDDISDWLTISVRYKPHGEKESLLIESIVNSENYNEVASLDSQFISNVVAFGLILNKSEYIKDYDIDTVIENVKKLEDLDEDRVEFLSLLKGYKVYKTDIA